MIRDIEIQRLTNYIKGLGLKISYTSKDIDSSAVWALDNTEITICNKYNTTKIETALSLIHEAGHALHNIHEKNRKVDPKFKKALNHVDEAEESGLDTKKRDRKIILENEIAGTYYWESIYRETDMKFPIWRLEAAKEYDMWQYKIFYETGDFPLVKERNKKKKEIKNKHRSKHNG